MSISDKKKNVAGKMIQHTHYDRKLGKLVRTMVPESKEHKMSVKKMNTHMSKQKELSEKDKTDYQKRTGRGYNE